MITRRRRKDGAFVDVEIHGIPLVIDGELRGVYGLYLDITDRTRAESSLRELSLELMHLQEKEKRRVARELHDATSQELALLNLNLGKLARMVTPKDREMGALVADIRDLTRQCTQKIRSVSYLLHPPLLQEAGLRPAISWLAEGFEQRSGIHVNVSISSKLGRLAEEAELTIFRVVQESLSNVLRHTTSSVVDIRIRRLSRMVKLQVENHGSGNGTVPSGNLLHRHGVGIAGMRERLEELGGRLDVCSALNGTMVTASLPIKVPTHA
jgi:signal transduction histidine kinase